MRILTHRIYDPSPGLSGARILVDRLWPRGISKVNAAIDHWARDLAPSNELRRWYSHDPAKWDVFKLRYFEELDRQLEAVQTFWDAWSTDDLILLFSSKEMELNNATSFKLYLEQRYSQAMI